MFDTTLTDEFLRLAETFGFDEAVFERLTLNALRATFLGAGEKRRLEGVVREVFERLRSS